MKPLTDRNYHNSVLTHKLWPFYCNTVAFSVMQKSHNSTFEKYMYKTETITALDRILQEFTEINKNQQKLPKSNKV